ncbi:hypothetical protein [uncultured Aquimarina sp.]|uniref:hypothetical protein n=1 Tax=uncultured Aquimarina sp. TaxID=575652 RepID=UPI00262EFFE7|nr:hypothetical protein [uncultured Aquimarina sp.]
MLQKILNLKGVNELPKAQMKIIKGGLACFGDDAICPAHSVCVNNFCTSNGC